MILVFHMTIILGREVLDGKSPTRLVAAGSVMV